MSEERRRDERKKQFPSRWKSLEAVSLVSLLILPLKLEEKLLTSRRRFIN